MNLLATLWLRVLALVDVREIPAPTAGDPPVAVQVVRIELVAATPTSQNILTYAPVETVAVGATLENVIPQVAVEEEVRAAFAAANRDSVVAQTTFNAYGRVDLRKATNPRRRLMGALG